MKSQERVTVLAVITAFSVVALSTFIHMPTTSIPLEIIGMKYSDIVYGVFLDIFSPENIDRPIKLGMRWYNSTLFTLFITGQSKYCPLPYIDYFLEYPPVVALIMLFSTCTSFNLVLPQEYDYTTYSNLIISIAQYHLVLNALIILVFALLMVTYLVKLINLLNLHDRLNRVIIMLFLPSFMIYSVYNWDIIASSLFIMSLYYLCKKRLIVSSILIGLSILTKLLPALFVVTFTLSFIFGNNYVIKTGKDLFKYVFTSVLLILMVVLPIHVASPEVLSDFLMYHGGWYCENCLYQIFIRDLNDPLHRLLALIFTLLTIIVSSLKIKVNSHMDLLRLALISIIASTVLNYIFTPQMILLIAPLALVVLSKRELIPYLVADVANTLMMVLFFMDEELRRLVNMYLGMNLNTTFNPWSIDSPIQWLAMLRNILLLILLIKLIVVHRYEHKSRIETNHYY